MPNTTSTNISGLDLFDGPLKETLIIAAKKALEFQKTLRPECKADGTLVTEADKTLEKLLTKELLSSYPGSQVLGEETMALYEPGKGPAFDFSKKTWVIDPIDGTALYAYHMKGWGISLGLMEKGAFNDGIVLFPSARPGKTTLVIGSNASGLQKIWLDLETKEFEPEALLHLPPIDGFPGLIGISQTLAKNAFYQGTHTVLNTASCVSSLFYLIERSLCGYCAKVKVWDMAALWPLAKREGIRACDYQGREMTELLDEGVWHLNPTDPKYLAQRSHILYYHPDLLDPKEFWKNLSWRDGLVL